jgi:hypothetical protein
MLATAFPAQQQVANTPNALRLNRERKTTWLQERKD